MHGMAIKTPSLGVFEVRVGLGGGVTGEGGGLVLHPCQRCGGGRNTSATIRYTVLTLLHDFPSLA